MRSKKTVMAAMLFLIFSIYPQTALAQNDHDPEAINVTAGVEPSDGTENGVGAAEADEKTTPFLNRKSVVVSTGCAIGFAVGSALPGIGNIVGCGIGGFLAWIIKK